MSSVVCFPALFSSSWTSLWLFWAVTICERSTGRLHGCEMVLADFGWVSLYPFMCHDVSKEWKWFLKKVALFYIEGETGSMVTRENLLEMLEMFWNCFGIHNNIINTIQHFPFTSRSTCSISLWKDAAEFFRPKGRQWNSYSPVDVTKAVFLILSVAIFSCQYPLFKSSVLKTVAPWRNTKISWIWGIG